jgi:hypothetical protein
MKKLILSTIMLMFVWTGFACDVGMYEGEYSLSTFEEGDNFYIITSPDETDKIGFVPYKGILNIKEDTISFYVKTDDVDRFEESQVFDIVHNCLGYVCGKGIWNKRFFDSIMIDFKKECVIVTNFDANGLNVHLMKIEKVK